MYLVLVQYSMKNILIEFVNSYYTDDFYITYLLYNIFFILYKITVTVC